MPKQINIGDLVWASMKGLPSWPGKVIAPPDKETRPRKDFHFLSFFGTEYHAWVQQDCIEMHSKEVLEKNKKENGEIFLKAIKILTDMSNTEVVTDDFLSNEESETTDESCCCSIISGGKSYSSIVELPDFTQNYNHLNLQCDEETETAYDTPGTSRPYPKWSSPPAPKEFVERPATPPFNFHKSGYLKEKKPIKKIIGFFGYNKIAQGIMRNLSLSGHSILLWNRKPDECKKFADKLNIKISSSPTDVVKAAHYIFCCSSNTQFPLEINDSILKGIELSKDNRKNYIEMTPIPAKLHKILSCEIKLRGAQYLEASYRGSITNANEGTLFLTAAGDKTLYDQCKTCFDAISKHHIFVSAEVGTASKYNNTYNRYFRNCDYFFSRKFKTGGKIGTR